MKNKCHRTLALVISLLTAFFISGCTPPPVTTYPPPAAEPVVLPPTPPAGAANSDAIRKANALFRSGKRREAAHAYYQAGLKSPSPQRERLILQAVEAAAILKDTQLMQQFFASIDTNRLDRNNRVRYNYGKGLLALYQKQPAIALDILPNQVSNLPVELAKKIRLARYSAARELGNPVLQATELIQLHSLDNKPLSDADSQRIWQTLGKLSLNQLNSERRKQKTSVLRGWFDLAYIKKVSFSDETLSNNLQNWHKNYPHHPATSFSHTLLADNTPAAPTQPIADSTGKSIAVLLPFNGRFASVGKALYQGIVDAHKQITPDTRLLQLDTSSLDASVVYNQALQQGAEFILGPFRKENILSMSRNGYLPKPALSLNYLPANTSHPNNLFQIGLLPEDEAIQIAQFAANKEQKKALLMVPDSSWGSRLENAFAHAYKERGGDLLNSVRYPNRATNYAQEISRLLANNSEADIIVMIGSPTQARLIYPAIRETLQRSESDKKPVVYATSHIYSGRPSPSLDNNLNGIIYTEIPYILTSTDAGSQQYPRLYALGQDALLISQKLGELQQGAAISGKTGEIRASNDGSLHRTLQWATFRDGVPVSYAQ